ncbi:MAG: LAGLIDADG family homing endonuclease [Candidatus Micrarchaeota archaeon]
MANVAKVKEFTLDADTTYLVGAIIGDGSIGNTKRTLPPLDEIDPRIIIEMGNYDFLEGVIAPLVDKLLQRKRTFKVRERKGRQGKLNSTWVVEFRSKYFHKFLTENLQIPAGKKANSVSISQIIELTKENNNARLHLLAGIFDTDGGLRGKSIGHSTASKKLRDEVVSLLKDLGFSIIVSEWLNKKYNKKYYEWKIGRHSLIQSFIEKIPLRNKEKLNAIKNRFNLNAGGEI